MSQQSGKSRKSSANGFQSKRPEYKPATTLDKVADVGGALTEATKPWLKFLLLSSLALLVIVAILFVCNYAFRAGEKAKVERDAAIAGGAAAPASRRDAPDPEQKVRGEIQGFVDQGQLPEAWSAFRFASGRLSPDVKRDIRKQLDEHTLKAVLPKLKQGQSECRQGNIEAARTLLESMRELVTFGPTHCKELDAFVEEFCKAECEYFLSKAKVAKEARTFDPCRTFLDSAKQSKCSPKEEVARLLTELMRLVEGRLQITPRTPGLVIRIKGKEFQSDSDGAWYGLPSGEQWIEILAPGFVPARERVSILSYSSVTPLSVQLTPAAAPSAWALYLLRDRPAFDVAALWYKRNPPPGFDEAWISRLRKVLPEKKKRAPAESGAIIDEFDKNMKKTDVLSALDQLGRRLARAMEKEPGSKIPESVFKARGDQIKNALAGIEQGCGACRGERQYDCPDCKDGWKGQDQPKGKKVVKPAVMCTSCDGKGRRDCEDCNRTGQRDQMILAKRQQSEQELQSDLKH